MSDPGPIQFPKPRPRETTPPLVLRRRTPFSDAAGLLDASVAARESIYAVVSASQAPFGSMHGLTVERLTELEQMLRQLERTLGERERAIADMEARLTERERDVAETEALLVAREQLALAAHQPSAAGTVSPEARAALDRLKAELARQETTLLEAKQAVRDREAFLDEAETRLFEKVQEQQHKENELEQREEDLQARLRRVREQEARFDPAAAAALEAEAEAARKRDEFKE